jgi:hypothetical protein
MPADTTEPADTPRRPRLRGLAWLFVWLIGLELAARLLWTPAWIGARLYGEVDPSFDYGFGYGIGYVRPQCEPDGETRVTCFKTQYRSIFRQSFERVKRPRTLRSFTVGGSHAAGPGAYTTTAIRTLRAGCGALRWEGVNLAVRGQGSTRALVATEEALRHDPDLIILDFGGTNEYEDERDLAQRTQVHEGIWEYLLASRVIVIGRKLLSRRFAVMRTPPVPGDGERVASSVPANLSRWERTLAANYRELIAMARARKIPVVVVGRASFRGHRPGSRALANHQRFLSLAGDGVLLFDAHAAFMALPRAQRAGLFLPDRNHYSREGHRIVGEGLAELLLRELPAARVCSPR